MADDVLLDLDTLIVRKTIAIDGEHFEILNPDELSVMTSFELSRRGKRIDELVAGATPSKPDELDELVTQTSRTVLVDVPAPVFEKLSGTQKLAIVDVFTGLLVRSKLGVAGALAKALDQQSIGGSASPAFSDSMAASPIGGWRKRLARWFGLI